MESGPTNSLPRIICLSHTRLRRTLLLLSLLLLLLLSLPLPPPGHVCWGTCRKQRPPSTSPRGQPCPTTCAAPGSTAACAIKAKENSTPRRPCCPTRKTHGRRGFQKLPACGRPGGIRLVLLMPVGRGGHGEGTVHFRRLPAGVSGLQFTPSPYQPPCSMNFPCCRLSPSCGLGPPMIRPR